jgi:mono/diheme cytochrome c family protein
MESPRKTMFFLTSLLLAGILLAPARSQADDAAALFKEKCAACHGEDGAAKTTAGKKMDAADLRSKHVQSLSDNEVYESIAEGKNHKNYPHAYLYKGMSEKQIRGLVGHIRRLK